MKNKAMNLTKGKSQKLYKKASSIIPGGTQLLSKRAEVFLPEFWPAYYSKAKGCEVWDLDGKKYIDMSFMGIGANILGYSDPDIDKAVKSAIDKGSMSTLNVPEEIELAELLCRLHPWAKMARFARTGGEAMAIAVRIARAASGKEKVLFCGYHGWHDWYLAANLSSKKALDGHLLPGLPPVGVPRSLKDTSFPFQYNDTKGFKQLVQKHKSSIGVIVLETIRHHQPNKDFIKAIHEARNSCKAVLVIDEISSGWRLNLGGAHLLYGIKPDIAVFAKGMSNGYPMAAIIGKKRTMEKANDAFISSTYWTEKIGPVAALASIKKMKKYKVFDHLNEVGKEIQEGWEKLAKKNNIQISISGIYPLSHFNFEHKDPTACKTLFTQKMLEEGFLATTSCYTSYSHKKVHIKKYLDATDRVFAFIAKAIKKGTVKKDLLGPVCHLGFKRLT